MNASEIIARVSARSLFSAGLVAGGFAVAAVPAHALTVFIDEFTVTRGGAAFFTDTFIDGNLPPSAPNLVSGAAASYNVFGAGGVGPESNGKLFLNSANGGVTANAIGTVVRDVQVRLVTNTDPLSALGLKPGGSFTTTGLFDLGSAVFTPSSSFQVQLRERTQASGAALAISQVRVGRPLTGNLFIDFRYQDFVLDTITPIGSTPLNLTGDPDQILLSLAYNFNGSRVTGGYQYFKSGLALGSFNQFGSTSPLFVQSNIVQAGFNAVETTAIPLPAAAWLFGAGLLAVAGFGRRSRTV